MKKCVLVACLVSGLFCSAVGAHALTYEADLAPNVPRISGSNVWSGSLMAPAHNFTSATLILNLSGVTSGTINTVIGLFTVPPIGGVNTTNPQPLFAGIVHNGLNTITLDAAALATLNSSISNGQLPLSFYMATGSATLNSVRLNGVLAPEPVSMVLVGAGLVGLPFARRFRKTICS